MPAQKHRFCNTCPLLPLQSELIHAIRSPGPTLPNSAIMKHVRDLADNTNCLQCLPVVKAEGPLVPMIKVLNARVLDGDRFEGLAKDMCTFTRRKFDIEF